MNDKTLRMLEYGKIVGELEKLAVTDKGKVLCRELMPAQQIQRVKKKLKETTEAVSLVLKFGEPPIAKMVDFDLLLAKIKMGAVLGMADLLHVASALKMMREVKEYFKDASTEEFLIMGEYFEHLYIQKLIHVLKLNKE